ncbi:GNAT family N-acetyltransferase [Ensifer adhaerens]|uniref:GNAT family N-acetyltransferase n=1 Tax=Ensifer adhaerens TaxID=106592 RepID=UPI001CC159DD|nr:GNAT family N-acetyltransferase [Ensifer adhaerens]MBZ7925686.1 GNAT family N-acetyltransferase [Ensifer adhaerens]UAX95174.1 GNAT family N-acetyltransferase [Ensifer adhaerens]UAY02935.1 GNAT family N-acetyltransferase [Ensifer adhaerens]UAY10919.1 GNAT family N-acetyltransferase [Ensifer adhaerens]
MQRLTSDIRIRAGEPQDAGSIHSAILAMGRGLDMADKVTCTVDDFSRFGFGPNAAFHSLLAEADGDLAGLCLFFPIFSTWRGRPGVFVQDLYVEGRFRGLGVGEALLREVAAWSSARGGDYLRLEVDVDNLPAQRLYERIGITWQAKDRAHAAYDEAFAALAGGPKV